MGLPDGVGSLCFWPVLKKYSDLEIWIWHHIFMRCFCSAPFIKDSLKYVILPSKIDALAIMHSHFWVLYSIKQIDFQ